MPRTLSAVIVVALSLLQLTTAFAAPAHKKRHVTRHWHGYGFLPGYRPPAVIERERASLCPPFIAGFPESPSAIWR